MNHIVTNMIKRNDTTIDITLIHPPKWTLSHLTAFKQAVEQLPNTTLFMTVPTPAAVVITHLASRMKDFDKDKKG
jgi:transcription termination factor NusB